MKELDHYLGQLMAQASLIGQTCHLNHGPEIEPPEAVDYLCQHLGNMKSSWPEILLTIPVCAECAYALTYDENWLLFYCLSCNHSQWLMKSRARKYYPKWESLIFLYKCPICFEEQS